MAKGGAFNVSQLIRELGLQTTTGETMRVLETIQPTMEVGDLRQNTPPHIAPSSFYGRNITAAGGLFATLEVQCLAPGGLFIEWITIVSAANISMRITNQAQAPGEAVLAPSGQNSRDPVVSIVRQGDVVFGTPVSTATLNQSQAFVPFSPNPIFVPRGRFFSLQSNTANTVATLSLGLREVPASEHAPA